MRARDSKRQAEELAAVVRWLRARADELYDACEALDGRPGVTGQRLSDECRTKAAALVDAATALERGEHHAPV